jgi:hypothetical protein
MEDLEKYLEEKWFSKELIGSLKEDYMSYLKWKKFYWPKGKYSDEVTESIKSNDKILKESLFKQETAWAILIQYC